MGLRQAQLTNFNGFQKQKSVIFGIRRTPEAQ